MTLPVALTTTYKLPNAVPGYVEPEYARHKAMERREDEVKALDAVLNEFAPPRKPSSKRGTGYVICAGGETYLTNAYILVRLLRLLGSTLPIEIWYAGGREYIPAFAKAMRPYGVSFHDGCKKGYERVPMAGMMCADGNVYQNGMIDGFGLKSYALCKTSLWNVIYLDADNTPHYNPERLLEGSQWNRAGALFWKDYKRYVTRPVWRYLMRAGAYRHRVAEWESGQMCIDTVRHWTALSMTNEMNRQRWRFYTILYGDKDTFQVGWYRTSSARFLPEKEPTLLDHGCETMAFRQYDFAGKPVFDHRVRGGKWTLNRTNHYLGHPYDEACADFMHELRTLV